MTIIECEQKSPEWYAARCGKPTASAFDKIVQSDGKPSKSRAKYMWRLAGERIIGTSCESFQSQAMLNGIEMEEEARRFYEFTNDVEVKNVGFCLSACGRYGASPDGLVGEDGMIEIKCPNLETHIGYLDKGTMPTEYLQQVQGELLVTGCKWCDFISYYPGLKPFVLRVYPDIHFQFTLANELESFCNEMEQLIARLA